jgi:hypothetical protein
MAAASTLTTSHRGHTIEVERFEWGYTARIRGVRGSRAVTVASASAYRVLIDALALVDDWLVDDWRVAPNG